MNQVASKPKVSSSRVYLKIFITVAALLAITAVAVFWAASSNGFVKFAADYLVGSIKPGAGKLEINGLSGSLRTGIEINAISWRKAAPYQMLVASKIKLRFDFARLIAGARIMTELDCEKVEFSGQPMPEWFKTLPNFPEIACMTRLPGNLFLAAVKINELVFRPFNDELVQLKFKEFMVEKPDQQRRQKLHCLVSGFLRERRFLDGDLHGFLDQKKQRLESRLEACFAGKKLITELVAANKKGHMEVSGHIVEAAIDLAIFSRWLISMWQNEFPFGFDGVVNLGGSWIYHEKTGFLGNLSGDFSKLHMVAQGLFLTIFELNGQWKFFDGNLELSDSGSSFAGFPAVLDGKIENLFNSSRRWNLNFKADHIDMGQFYQDLPWGLKYGSGLPQMNGTASFNLQIRGAYPEVAAAIKTERLAVNNAGIEHQLAGALSFAFNEKEKMQWQLNLQNTFSKGMPMLFQRFNSSGQNLTSWPDNFQGCVWSGKGKSMADMNLSGSLQASASLRLNGAFSDGNGHFAAVSSEGRAFNSGKTTFLQFLLSY